MSAKYDNPHRCKYLSEKENRPSVTTLTFPMRPAPNMTGSINTLRPRQNSRHFADDIIKCIFLNESLRIFIRIPPKSVPKGPIDKSQQWFSCGLEILSAKWWPISSDNTPMSQQIAFSDMARLVSRMLTPRTNIKWNLKKKTLSYS